MGVQQILTGPGDLRLVPASPPETHIQFRIPGNSLAADDVRKRLDRGQIAQLCIELKAGRQVVEGAQAELVARRRAFE